MRRELAPSGQNDQYRHQANADDHMDRVCAGHDEIENVEDARVIRVGAVPDKVFAGNQVFFVFVVVLEKLDREEHDAKRRRADKESNQSPLVAQLNLVNCHRHDEAAAEQDRHVDRSESNIKVTTRLTERAGKLSAIDRISEKERAEEQDLGCEEYPHSERRRLPLLLGIVKLMCQRAHSYKPVP